MDRKNIGTRFGQGLLAAAGAIALVGSAARAADDYEINVVLPLSGGASFLGKAEQQSLQLVEKSTNETGGIQGRNLKFVFHDDQSSPQTAVQLASQVVAGKPAVMLGSSIVAMCNAMAPLMAAAGPVQYCFSPGIHPAAGSYTFTSSVSTHDLGRALIRFYRMKGWTKIAIITSTDASGQDADKGFDEILKLPENKEVTIVSHQHFNPTDVSVSAQIETIKAAGPQALIAWSTGAPVATIFKSIIQSGLDVPVGTTDGNMTFAQMTQYADFLPKQLYIPAAEWVTYRTGSAKDPGVAKAQARFAEVFKAAGQTPDVASALSWDPAVAVVEALRKLGPAATAAQLRDYLGKLSGYAGIDGVYDFTKEAQRGLTVDDAVVTLWDPAAKTWQPMSQPAGAPL
jgi:branched-chain amino acid transport system substrate-binding protein